MTISKTCTKCGEDKAREAFSKCSAKKDGLSSYCKACQKSYAASNHIGNKALRNKACAERYYSMTLVERVAQSSVQKARHRSALSSPELYGGLSFTEACEVTLPFAKERLRMEALTGIEHNIDHIISINEGGTHTADNLQVLTFEANRAKG